MAFKDVMLIIVASVFVNNILLSQYLGNCPFLGVSKRMDTAVGMTAAVIFVLVLAGTATWSVYYYVLVPLKMEFLRTMVFILVIAALVQFVEMFLKKSMPPLYKALGVYLPLITTNCAVLGVCVINIDKKFALLPSVLYSFAYPLGFGVALMLFAGLRERFEVAPIPKFFVGTAIGLVTAGLISLSFLGFAGMVTK